MIGTANAPRNCGAPLTLVKTRRFTLFDGMVLMAMIALGLAWSRSMVIGFLDDPLSKRYFTESIKDNYDLICYIGFCLVLPCTPVLMTLTLALFALNFKAP